MLAEAKERRDARSAQATGAQISRCTDSAHSICAAKRSLEPLLLSTARMHRYSENI